MGNVAFDDPMSRHTSFKVGGPAEIYVSPDNTDLACEIIETARKFDIPVLVIGDGTNLVVSDQGIPGVVMVLSGISSTITAVQKDENHVIVHAHAGLKTRTLCRYAIDNGLSGMNFALGIPGTVGGNIAMNAGTHLGAMESVVNTLDIMNGSNSLRTLKREAIHFSYRRLDWEKSTGSEKPAVIFGATFLLEKGDPEAIRDEAKELLKKRTQSQPVSLPNAGCIFKNPEGHPPAGKLIDMAGMKGKSLGGAMISDRHANFIVNMGDAKATDILGLIDMARTAVHEKFNVELETEVKIVGD
jgi:UDP-N-acetylmuramate dehydrogenase